jgi:hypothetical protein
LVGLERVVDAPGGDRHTPVEGFVSQIVKVRGKPRPPSSALAVTVPAAPILIVEVTKNPTPLVPGILTMPSFDAVAPTAMTSGTGVVDADRMNVFTPLKLVTGAMFAQSNISGISVAPNAAAGVNENTKFLTPPAGTLTGPFGPNAGSIAFPAVTAR